MRFSALVPSPHSSQDLFPLRAGPSRRQAVLCPVSGPTVAAQKTVSATCGYLPLNLGAAAPPATGPRPPEIPQIPQSPTLAVPTAPVPTSPAAGIPVKPSSGG